MRKLSLAAAMLAAMTLPLAAGPVLAQASQQAKAGAQASAWTNVSDPALAFTIALPGTPQSQRTPGSDGSMEVMVTYHSEAGGTAYSLMVLNYRPGELDALPNDALLKAALEGGIGAVKGRETSRRQVTLQGQAGVEATFDLAIEGQSLLGRILITRKGPNIYGVMTFDSPGSTEANFRRLVSGFRMH